jgi:hypothetical protein
MCFTFPAVVTNLQLPLSMAFFSGYQLCRMPEAGSQRV